MFGQSQQWRNIEGHTVREPLGTVGLITSFNYPLLLTAWKLAPALAAGNCVIVKPAPQTPLSTLALASLASDILPAGVFNVLTGGTEIGEAMIDRVDKISFTGSTRVGQMIMQQASNKLTPVTLECGGKNAAIVCDDTHLRHAAEQVAMGAFSNAGQNCCAISRVLVQRKVYEPFLNELQMATAKWKAICDKEFHEEQEWYGPLIDDNQYRRVRSIIDGLDMKPFFEGHIQSSHGYFVPPTIYTGVQDDSYLATEELFAPVLSILNPFDEVDEAIHRVNQSKYGLAAGVFSNHMQTISKVSRYLKTGYIWVNQYNIMPPSLPFGGMKLSGIGKDLGQSGLNEFTVEKSIIGGFC
ncbi:aldehyde dehydrogenase domain-containing protein [Pilobolus umbonatus]|nr:aldehyde dehydrogenase domain-containing protein [Pilobolus umbonatus]